MAQQLKLLIVSPRRSLTSLEKNLALQNDVLGLETIILSKKEFGSEGLRGGTRTRTGTEAVSETATATATVAGAEYEINPKVQF